MEYYKRMTDSESGIADPTVPREAASVLSFPLSSSQKTGRAVKGLKILAIIQFVSAILIFILGSTCFGIGNSNHSYVGGCSDASGIWAGAVCIISASFAIVSSRRPRSRCYMILYLVLAIIACIFAGIIIIFSVVWADNSMDNYPSNASRKYDHRLDRANGGILICLVIVGFLHMICCIVSSSFICYIWRKTGGCCSGAKEPGPTVIYAIPPTTGLRNEQFVMVPISIIQQQGVIREVPMMQKQ